MAGPTGTQNYKVKFKENIIKVRAKSEKHAKFIAWKKYAKKHMKGKPFKEIINHQKKFWNEASVK